MKMDRHDISKTIEEIARLNARLEGCTDSLAKLEKAKIYATAKEGEHIGHGKYPKNILSITYMEAFMGFGTGANNEIEIDKHGIYGFQFTEKIVDALAEAITEERDRLKAEIKNKAQLIEEL